MWVDWNADSNARRSLERKALTANGGYAPRKGPSDSSAGADMAMRFAEATERPICEHTLTLLNNTEHY